MKISIIGAGAWGTAIANTLSKNNIYEVKIWSFEEDVNNDINKNHENSKYLKGIKLSENLVSSTDLLDVASNSDYIFLVTPSLHTIKILESLNESKALVNKPHIAVLTKGFVNLNNKIETIVEALEKILPEYSGEFVYIAGPSHAEEVGLGIYTGLIAASKSRQNANKFIDLFNNSSISMFYSSDVLGVQLASALKNIFAIAFGILDEFKNKSKNFIGNNTESFLFSVALNDMMNMSFSLGASKSETFIFLAGSGDLDVTCRSIFGRNRRFGSEIVSKNILKDFSGIDNLIDNIDKLGYLPEGLVAARETYILLTQRNIVLNNLATLVYKIINKEEKPESLINYLHEYKN